MDKRRLKISSTSTVCASSIQLHSVPAMRNFRFLLLTTFASLTFCMHTQDHLNEELGTTHQENTKYCNDWAVEIHGGMEMANNLADKHGFINLGRVLNSF